MTLRVGILGFGGAGQAHASYFACVPGCRVTKVFDAKPAGLARAAELVPAVAACADLERFWPELDAVSVCTPDATHAEYVVAALERGLHVLCEKPLTDSLDGLRKVLAAEARAGRTLAVLHQMRFVLLHRAIKQAVGAGRLGALSYLEGYYVHDLTRRAFEYDSWRREGNATPLVYAGCHFVDLLRWFTGSEIDEVWAASNHLAYPEYPEADLTVATLRFSSGTLGKVLVSLGSAVPQDHAVRLYGSLASIENNVLFDRERGWAGLLHEPVILQRKLLRDPNRANRHDLLSQLRRNLPAWALGKAFGALRLLARRPGAEYGARYYPVRLYEHALACVEAVEDFATAIREGRRPQCTAEEAAKTVLACLAGVESSRTGRPVRVPRLAEAL
ncbi:MAG: Gfo/Idh/MocA family oxidoreductase [Candidatus Rokubacteria bacterium]|nr:Gfo/Idh/MocA family oxidoreductase [Candidatus Rokubacteria bacterium]